jgi:pSer/pThr/pTyr-binding forkhead associated (FHA) protein
MRISFPNKERDDTLVDPGEARIGAAADNNIVIAGSGVAPHHLRLKLTEYGIELDVLDAQARTHVNTRPVREKAILRLGDVVSVGSVPFVLKPDRDADIRTDVPSALPPQPPSSTSRSLPPRVVLRGLSGTHFGKIVPVRGSIVVGRGGQADLNLDDTSIAERHATIEIDRDTIVLRDLAQGNVQVNGVPVCAAILQAGDQLCFGHERFLVEAPGLPQRSLPVASVWFSANSMIAQKTVPVVAPPAKPAPAVEPVMVESEPASSRNDIWWLIAAAAVIAAGLALLFRIV